MRVLTCLHGWPFLEIKTNHSITLTNGGEIVEQMVTSAMPFLDFLHKVWPIISAVLIAVVIYSRTKSLYFLFYRVFSLLGLEGKYSNPDDQKASDELLDLNRFNLKTGLRLESVRAKSNLHEWMRSNDVELSELRLAGSYFKANELRFDINQSLAMRTARVIAPIVGLLFLVCAQLLITPDKALLKVTATGTWFWAGQHYEANSFSYDAWELFRDKEWKIKPYHCKYVDGAGPAGSSWDKNVICTVVLGFYGDYVAETIRSQKNLGGVLAILGFIILVFWALRTKWQNHAVKLNKRLSIKQGEAVLNKHETVRPQLDSYMLPEWSGNQFSESYGAVSRSMKCAVNFEKTNQSES